MGVNNFYQPKRFRNAFIVLLVSFILSGSAAFGSDDDTVYSKRRVPTYIVLERKDDHYVLKFITLDRADAGLTRNAFSSTLFGSPPVAQAREQILVLNPNEKGRDLIHLRQRLESFFSRIGTDSPQAAAKEFLQDQEKALHGYALTHYFRENIADGSPFSKRVLDLLETSSLSVKMEGINDLIEFIDSMPGWTAEKHRMIERIEQHFSGYDGFFSGQRFRETIRISGRIELQLQSSWSGSYEIHPDGSVTVYAAHLGGPLAPLRITAEPMNALVPQEEVDGMLGTIALSVRGR